MDQTKKGQRHRTVRRRTGSGRAAWERYEQLKREMTVSATTSAEYDEACRRAAKLSGV